MARGNALVRVDAQQPRSPARATQERAGCTFHLYHDSGINFSPPGRRVENRGDWILGVDLILRSHRALREL